MKKNYFFILLFTLAFFSTQQLVAQNNADSNLFGQNIEGLSIYPNPVTSGKSFIYITSKQNSTKKIEFFNVLGKQIFSVVLTNKEVNISSLSRGVYILKITENNVTETRKLVIK